MSLIPFSFEFSVACPSNSTPYLARYNNDVGSICSAQEQVVFIANGNTFTTGTTVYTDAGLTNPLVGFTYLSETVSGTVWNINSSTGVIGTSTGDAC